MSACAYALTADQYNWARTVGGENVRRVIQLAQGGKFGDIRIAPKTGKEIFYARFCVAGVKGVTSAYVRAAIDAYRTKYGELHPDEDAEIARLSAEVEKRLAELDGVDFLMEED